MRLPKILTLPLHVWADLASNQVNMSQVVTVAATQMEIRYELNSKGPVGSSPVHLQQRVFPRWCHVLQP